MIYNKEQLTNEINRINEIISSDPLPSWDDLPNLELYMDQVIILLNRYLKLFSADCENNKFITPPMINNYVKLKIMPPPVKKKYGRLHLAYLIIICSLKQTLSMSTIQKIIPLSLCEEDVKEIYMSFVYNNKIILEASTQKIGALLDTDDTPENAEKIKSLVIKSAIASILTKLFAEKISDSKN